MLENCGVVMQYVSILKVVTILAIGPLLSGCVVSAVKTVVTAPFKVAGAVVDAATTSQDEADLKRGRAARKNAEEQEKADRKARKRAKDDN